MEQAQAQAIAASKISGIPVAQEQPSPAPETPDQPVIEAEGQPEGEPEQQQAESEYEDFEFDGLRFPVPKQHVQKLKDSVLAQADYTRKTQEVSERARTISQQEKLFQVQQQFHRESVDDISAIKALDMQLAQFANVDWMNLPAEQAMRTRFAYDQLKEKRQESLNSLNQKWATFNQTREKQLKEFAKAGRDEASRRIKGFGDKEANELTDYLKKTGYMEEEIANLFYNARDVEMLWKARQFDALQDQKGSINQRVAKAPPVPKPGPSQPVKADTTLKIFQGTKDRATKEKLGAQILAKKMRFM